jgi:hypothetical protein
MSGEHFKTIDLTSCRRALSELHELVTRGHGRVQIKRRGCDDVCVLANQMAVISFATRVFTCESTVIFSVAVVTSKPTTQQTPALNFNFSFFA